MTKKFGQIILLGSGETAPTGRAILRNYLRDLDLKQKVAIIETPAGFQPSSAFVADEIAQVFGSSLKEFVSDVKVIPARKKGKGRYNTDNEEIVHSLKETTFFFLGPGSPTYTIKNLRNSKVWAEIIKLWQEGATISLSSAAALAAGSYTLPVYEIYKAGFDLYWEKGLNIFAPLKLPITVITHWNNTEGGENLDTRFCFMGHDRFQNLVSSLPQNQLVLGIDEHTAVVFDFKNNLFFVTGAGKAFLLKNRQELVFDQAEKYSLDSFKLYKVIPVRTPTTNQSADKSFNDTQKPLSFEKLPENIKNLAQKRETERKKKNFKEADRLRKKLEERGFRIEDQETGTLLFRI
jgi:cyanophycinase-like exopeptidase